MSFKLRQYQEDTVAEARRRLVDFKRVIIKAATGAGKTEMSMAIIKMAVAKGKRVAFIVNRVKLLEQTSRRFFKAGIHHGIIQSTNTRNPDAAVVVCSIQTVARRSLPPVDLIIVDEAHCVAGSKDYRELIFSRDNVPLLGVTATPYSRGLGKFYPELNGKLFETMVEAASIATLTEQGFLVDCDIYAPSEPDLTNVRTQRNSFGEIDYSETDLAKAVDKPNLIGDIVEHWKRLGRGKPTICFATNIQHSNHIVAEFNAAGIPACHIDCYMDAEESDHLVEQFKAGEFTILSNVALLAEGFDHPETEVMILARPTRSLIRYIQMGGRILRPADGKERGLILDHSGSTLRLGYPNEDRDIPLCDGRPQQTTQPKKKEEPLPKKCPSCHFLKPARVHACPRCGFAPQKPLGIETDRHEQLTKLDRSKATMADKQNWYSQLVKVRIEKNYKEHWADHAYRDKFGVWPRGMKDVPAKEVSKEVSGWLIHRNIKRAKSRGAQA
jgi:superfamily II DNA or RNA helicase